MPTVTTTRTSAASNGITTTVTTTEATPPSGGSPAPSGVGAGAAAAAEGEDDAVWIPPAAIEELFSQTAGNKFASINAPTSGAREEKVLASGDAPFQLYSLGTPNGVKVSILFEELEEVFI